ncbi:MAG: peptidogalycan biosysnthesis protein, partial [Pseudomonadota bacterium]
AGALNFIGGDTLYGRYWGCTESVPFLHFELCYHCAIDYAITEGLARVEAGAQGDHKLARGYEPVATQSAHWIRDPSFRDAIKNYLAAERRQTDADIDALKAYTPYRKNNST